MSIQESETVSIDTGAKNLNAVEQHTIDESHVRGVVEDVDTETADVTVAKLTTGESITEEMSFPETWTEEYKFVRLVNELGYSAEGAEQMEGEKVRLNVSGKNTFIDLPESEENDSISLSEWLILIGLLGIGFSISAGIYAVSGLPPFGILVILFISMAVTFAAADLESQKND